MNENSFFKVYRGQPWPCGTSPLAIIAAQTERPQFHFTEHFITVPDLEKGIKSERSTYEVDFSTLAPNQLSLTNLFDSQLRAAEAWLGHHLYERYGKDREIYFHLVPYRLVEVGLDELLYLMLRKLEAKHLEFIETRSRCTALRKHLDQVKPLARVLMKIQVPEETP